jgi:hypothetical protein
LNNTSSKKIAPNLKITKDTLFETSLRFKNILRNKDIPQVPKISLRCPPRKRKKEGMLANL